MKRILLSLAVFTFSLALSAQDCSTVFISGYVEGYSNNRALELYNATDEAVNMSDYSVGRFSNGATSLTSVQLPDAILEPYDTYVVVLDKQDPNGSSFEEPVWNGYVLLDTIYDDVTGEPVLNDDGEVIIGVQYDDEGGTLYGDEYNEWYDLQGKADAFVTPVYNVNNAFYFNGNDAVALITGTELEPDGSNLLDVVGVIGEDPGDSWVDADGGWVTKDRSLTRKFGIQAGSIAIAALGGTFDGSGWNISFKNDFSGLGRHECACGTTGVDELNTIQFKVFPNPTDGQELNLFAEANIQSWEIYDMTGQLVATEILSNSSQYAEVQLSDTVTGFYILKVNFEDGYQSANKIMVR